MIMETNVAVILSGSDYEWLFINGMMIDSDHSLDRPEDWVRWTNKYRITRVERYELNKEDELYSTEYGYLPDELTGDYKEVVKGDVGKIHVDEDGNEYEYLGIYQGDYIFRPLGETNYRKTFEGIVPFSHFPNNFKIF